METANQKEKEKDAPIELTIREVLSVDNLQRVWKAIKRTYREELLRDPLDLLAFEANLEVNLKQLAFAISHGQYRPAPQIIIRGAKRDGMTRPLSFLEIADTIVLKAITDALQDNLHKDFPDCVGFSRSHQRTMRGNPRDYEGWIQAWLRHQRIVKDLIRGKGCDFIVECDISNFFATINHRLLRQYIAHRGHADDKLINLLFFMLESMTWRPEYSENLNVGIPQENYDASRILAHGFLYPVDQDFQKEVELGRYARWVDDFYITVPNEDEGKHVIKRLQQALEKRGLFLNTAKSVIVGAELFAKSLYPELNALLDHVHKSVRTVGVVHPIEFPEFERALSEFLSTPKRDRLSTWDRILRRFYTESRRIGSPTLEDYAFAHLREFPASAPNILSYLLGRPFRQEVLSEILIYLASPANIYQDVEIRVYEFLLEWCVPADPTIATRIADNCLDLFFGRNGYRVPLTEHTRGLISLLAYKFGGSEHMAQLAEYFGRDVVHDPAFARYALAVLVGTDYRDQAFAVAEKVEDRTTRRLHSFLSALGKNPEPYKDVLKRYVAVCHRTPPERPYFPARMLPLVRLVRCNMDFRSEWDRHLKSVLRRLESVEGPLQDQTSILFIQREIARP